MKSQCGCALVEGTKEKGKGERERKREKEREREGEGERRRAEGLLHTFRDLVLQAAGLRVLCREPVTQADLVQDPV